jgi:hypothetical protein
MIKKNYRKITEAKYFVLRRLKNVDFRLFQAVHWLWDFYLRKYRKKLELELQD